MSKRFTISEHIVEEIERQTDDEDLRILARLIIEYEIENWRKDRPRYASSYESIIDKILRRRITRNENKDT